jgi:hypothetical protein
VGIPAGTVLFRAFAAGNGTIDPGVPTSLTPMGAVLVVVATLGVAGLLAAVPA